MTATTFRTDPEKLKRIDKLAKSLGHSRSWLLNKAIDDLLEYQEWFAGQVQTGLEEEEKSQFASADKIENLFQQYGA